MIAKDVEQSSYSVEILNFRSILLRKSKLTASNQSQLHQDMLELFMILDTAEIPVEAKRSLLELTRQLYDQVHGIEQLTVDNVFKYSQSTRQIMDSISLPEKPVLQQLTPSYYNRFLLGSVLIGLVGIPFLPWKQTASLAVLAFISLTLMDDGVSTKKGIEDTVCASIRKIVATATQCIPRTYHDRDTRHIVPDSAPHVSQLTTYKEPSILKRIADSLENMLTDDNAHFIAEPQRQREVDKLLTRFEKNVKKSLKHVENEVKHLSEGLTSGTVYQPNFTNSDGEKSLWNSVDKACQYATGQRFFSPTSINHEAKKAVKSAIERVFG